MRRYIVNRHTSDQLLPEVKGQDIFDLSLIRSVAEKIAESGWLLRSSL